ncbi:hypothetical protein [Streptomyces mirabilis]|uniref:hypothetical protein n=1 Tax=Streptomyces mirabilis TaxID=68239 RepID=UPI0036A469CD
MPTKKSPAPLLSHRQPATQGTQAADRLRSPLITAHRITDALSRLTAGGLTAIGNAPSWIAVLILLPTLLGAGIQSFTAVLASISTFRAESAQRRQRDRLLNLADPDRGLTHLERITLHALPPAPSSATDSPPSDSSDRPQPGSPP